MRRRCPTPTKARYASQIDAIAAAVRTSRTLGLLRAYRCPCGRWHLTRTAKA